MSIFIWSVATLVFLIDQISKYLISQKLALGSSIIVIKKVFLITLVHNSGAAFGIFKNQTFFFIALSILTIVAILLFVKKSSNRNTLTNAALALILGGALGNLVDRLRFGYVIDFLDFRVWPVFNVADSAITCGVFLLILNILFFKKKTRRG